MTLLRAWRSSTLFSLLLLVWANSPGIAQARSADKQPLNLAEVCDDDAREVRDLFQHMLFSVPGTSNASDLSEPCSTFPRKEKEPKRPDQPDEAERFYFLKRVPPGATQLPMQRYELARQHVRQMTRFSSRQARVLPSLAEAQRANAIQPPEASALETWIPLGPGNIGGRTRALLIHPTTPDIMWAAGVAGGVWKTTNGGGSWIPLTDVILPNLAVASMAIDPGNPNVIYAGTGEGFFNFDAVRGNGIFKTTDGGNTWNQLAATGNSNFQHVNDIVVSPSNTRVYAATRTGVWRSNNGGATWTQIHNPGVQGGCLDLVIRTDTGPNDTVFASCGTFTAATVFRNTNANGAGTWEAVLSDGAPMGRTSLALAPSNQSIIYALSAQATSGQFQHGLHKVFRSTTGGDTWETRLANATATGVNKLLLTNPLLGFGGCPFGTQISSQGWYDNVIAVDPLDSDRVWAGGIDLFRSDDGGMNWGQASHWFANPASPRMAHADQHAIVFHPQYNGASNKTMFVGNDGGVYRTTDARAATGNNPCDLASGSVPWSNLNNGYAVTQFYHGVPFPDGTEYFGGTQDNGTIFGADGIGPNSWVQIQGGDGGYVAVDPNDTQILYAEFTGASITKSTDGGLSFQDATIGINPAGFLFIAPFTMDPSNSQNLWTGGAQIWRTTNGAANWVQASTTIANDAPPPNESVSSLAVAPTDSNRMLAGTNRGDIHRQTAALSADLSTVWPSVRPRSGFVSWLTFDPVNPDIAYATYSSFNSTGNIGHVWKSVNGGATWTNIDGTGAAGLPDVPAHSIVIDPTDSQRLYVGTDVGVFTSTNGGINWMLENTGFANVVTEALAITDRTGAPNLFAFTHGRGAWRVPIAPPADFALAISNPSQTVFAGQTATFNGTLTSIGGYSNLVQITCQPGATAVPATCNGASATPADPPQAFSVTASSVVTQDFAFNIRGVGSDVAATTHSQPVTLSVVDYALTAPNPTSVTVVKGSTSSAITFLVTASGSYAGSVTLDCTGLPAGATCDFFPTAVVAPRAGSPVSVSLTIETLASTPTFNNTITIRGQSNAPVGTRTQPLTLNVTTSGSSSDLSVVVTHSVAGKAQFGSRVTFSVLTTNNGPDTANNVDITILHTGGRLRSIAPPPLCTPLGNNAINCTIAEITSGGNNLLQPVFEATVTGAISVSATVSSDSADASQLDNTDTDSIKVQPRPRSLRGN